ncbi:MAG: heparinase II/III family protein [Candidatus Pelagibacter sp.]
MLLKNSISLINEFFSLSIDQIRKIYLNSNIYNKKISIIENYTLNYKPSLSILSCLVKYEKKKNKIEDFYVNTIWEKKINNRDLKKLHSFYWFFTIDLKSSKEITHSIVENWIKKNQKYNSDIWEINTLSKRIISWIANSQLTYEDTSEEYKILFNRMILKQVNHLINEINRSKIVDDKMIGCTAIILTGLSYNHEKFLSYGLNLLKKIINSSFDNEYYPKSRNIRQLVFYLKYFVLIRELLKESLNDIPDYLNEIVYYIGKAYNFSWGSIKESLLFNGNHVSDLSDFDQYLNLYKYKFTNDRHELGGYSILKNKNIIIAMDIGSSPEKKYSDNYQSGPLSFEAIYKGNKIICNSGYFQSENHKLNNISRSTAAHSTLILNNRSASTFKKKNKKNILENGLKSLDKNIVFEKNFWSIKGSHSGYLKEFGTIHERTLEFFPESIKILGKDKLIKKKNYISTNFEIRFHLMPNTKVTKTQDNRTVLIELENSGWKFFTNHGIISIETGLYFGKKNTYSENQNIFISGNTQKENQLVEWEIIKIK